MGDEDFYMCLPSNASKDTYPENKISRFRTKLAKQIDLKGSWEVGLIEIQYPRTWKTVKDECVIFIDSENKLVQAQINIDTGFYNNINALISELNSRVSHHTLSFGYDQIKHKVFIKTLNNIDVMFKGSLAIILGFKQDVWQSCFGPELRNYAPHPVDLNGGFYALYIYSDLAAYQLVGHSFVPLLRSVNISGGNHDLINTRFSKPHYCAVTKSHFDDVLIEIKTDQNQLVDFSYGKVIVKLHFRPTKHGLNL